MEAKTRRKPYNLVFYKENLESCKEIALVHFYTKESGDRYDFNTISINDRYSPTFTSYNRADRGATTYSIDEVRKREAEVGYKEIPTESYRHWRNILEYKLKGRKAEREAKLKGVNASEATQEEEGSLAIDERSVIAVEAQSLNNAKLQAN